MPDQSDLSYVLGHVGQLEDDAKLLRKRSGEAYASGRDDEYARWYRDLAREWEQRAATKRGKYDEMKLQMEEHPDA